MPQYFSPGVYVEEVPSSVKPIQGVGTSTGAFVGFADKGPIGEAVLIGNRAEFFSKFGGFIANADLAYAVNLFFQNGGTRCYVVRTCAHGISGRLAIASTFTFQDGAAVNALRVDAYSPGAWGESISITIEHPAAAPAFRLIVYYRGEQVERYDSVELDPASVTFVETLVNDISTYIRVDANPGSLVTLPARPVVDTRRNLAGGSNGIITASISDSDFTGPDGLQAFDPVDDINIVAIPDSASRNVMLMGINYCEMRADCFFVAHATESIDTAAEARDFKQATGSAYIGQNALNSSYGALYVPYVNVPDPLTNKTKLVSPVGAVVGRYSATDIRRGVHKAPAGQEDGLLRGVLSLKRQFSQAELAVLNPLNVNVLRNISGVGNVIWGARTVSADPEFRYVGTRRLLLFIEESIEEGTQWVVFEPNTPSLWRAIERNIRAFLRVVWRTGALFGDTEDKAFYVKCDAETNPSDSIEEGKVITEIGVAITKPAEFVIFRISQSKAGAEISE